MLRKYTPGLVTPAEAMLRIAKAMEPDLWRLEDIRHAEKRAWKSFVNTHDFNALTQSLSSNYAPMPGEQSRFLDAPEGRRWVGAHTAIVVLLNALEEGSILGKLLYLDGKIEDQAPTSWGDAALDLIKRGGIRGDYGRLYIDVYKEPADKMHSVILLDEKEIERLISGEEALASIAAPLPPHDDVIDFLRSRYVNAWSNGKLLPSCDADDYPAAKAEWPEAKIGRLYIRTAREEVIAGLGEEFGDLANALRKRGPGKKRPDSPRI